MLLSTVGMMPARLSFAKVLACNSLMFDAGGVFGRAVRVLGKSKGLPEPD
jgi:hypothetical protein